MFTVANLCIIYDRIVVTAKLNASKQALLKNYESRVKLIPPPPPNLSHIFHPSNFPTQHNFRMRGYMSTVPDIRHIK